MSLAAALAGSLCANASAQVATTPRPAAPQPDTLVVESSARQMPQVVTVIHRLTGIKALALLRRSGEAVSLADDELVAAPNAVTSVIAGYALSDGQNIVVRIPLAEAEVEALSRYYGSTAPPARWSVRPAPAGKGTTTPPAPPRAAAPPATPRAATPAPSTGFVVVPSNGKQFEARYVGLDGGSGLSLLSISGLKVPAARDADEESLAVGQPVRLFAPLRAAGGSNAAPGTVSLRVVEIEGKIAEITRTTTGKVARLMVTAANLSPSIVGGVALNEAGETVGIVEVSDQRSARLIPAASVRRAAERLLARQSSVPRPWLGVRGMALTTIPNEKFFSIGWTELEAAELKKKYQGVLLTSVAPGTPAALANLRPGDVIVRANNYEIKSAEDFTWVLNEAGSGATVNFTYFRGQLPNASVLLPAQRPGVTAVSGPLPAITPDAFKLQPSEVAVKLSESFYPTMTMQRVEAFGVGGRAEGGSPSLARGLETVALSAKAAAHLGARGGQLVVFVDPESAAGRAGLRVFDVIESVDGRPLGRATWQSSVPQGGSRQLLLGVVREKQKLEITVKQREEKK